MRLPSGETCGLALSGLPNSVSRGISSTAVVLVIVSPIFRIFKPGNYFLSNGKFKRFTHLLEVLWYIPVTDANHFMSVKGSCCVSSILHLCHCIRTCVTYTTIFCQGKTWQSFS